METRRLALLIDGDNAQASLLPEMLAEVSKYGIITIRRVYGDWTEANMKSWKEQLHVYALQPMQQFRYTVGKNATDSALIIDAMDMLYTADIHGFCIASSDSDFTRLATRIREKNMYVMGIGRKLTPRSFVNACDLFVYTELLVEAPAAPATHTPNGAAQPEVAKPEKNTPSLPKFDKLFRKAFDVAVQEDGWAQLSALGSSLRQLDPAFDPRTYGHKQLSTLVQAHPTLIEVRSEKTTGDHVRLSVRPTGSTPTKKATSSTTAKKTAATKTNQTP